MLDCSDPAMLTGMPWLGCYLTTAKHMSFYTSFGTVMMLLAVTAPIAMLFGLLGALSARSKNLAIALPGRLYTALVRGIPDIAFFLFFVIALDQGLEWLRHQYYCPDWDAPVRQGSDFVVCQSAKLPLGNSPQWVHEIYGFSLAVFTFSIVFGAFAANVLFGAMQAVPAEQLKTAKAYGMSEGQTIWRVLLPQMWMYALPGLSNLWMILIKATPLLFLLGVEDIVYWARELGGTKTSQFTSYPHPDWRMWYFGALLIFYLCFTMLSEAVLLRITQRLSKGQATTAGEAQRKAQA